MILGIDPDTGAVAGYGAWTLANAIPTWKKNLPPAGWEATPWIRIPRFGIHTTYQHLVNTDGIKHADHLYAALEQAICAAPETSRGMFIELFTHFENVRAMRFFQRQNFQDIGTSEGNPTYRRFLRYPWQDDD